MIRYTKDEQDQIGRAAYDAMHQNDASGPWESLTSDRRWFWIQAGLAAVMASERINDDRMARWRDTHRNSKRIA